MTTLVKRNDDGSVEYFTEPMTIRDQFAMTAMQGDMLKSAQGEAQIKFFAEWAYLIADQMMIARTKDTNANMRNKERQERE